MKNKFYKLYGKRSKEVKKSLADYFNNKLNKKNELFNRNQEIVCNNPTEWHN